LHASAFDRFYEGRSLLHRLDPRVKVALALLLILANALLPEGAWWGFAASLALLLAMCALSGLGGGFTLRRSFIALPFALAAITTLFATPGPEWTSADLPLLGTVTITAPGAVRFTSILLRSWLSVQAAILLVAVTSFPDILHALRHLKVPGILVSIIAFMYRYLFVLTDEVLRLRRARDARSARLQPGKGGLSLLRRARTAGSMAGQLMLRSLERSDQIFNAMLARGYTGQLLTLNPHHMESKDWLAGVAGALLVAAVLAIGWWA
jgi:cobalt/nickel transport system permease protein